MIGPPVHPDAHLCLRQLSLADVESLFELPFAELLYQAQSVHRLNFRPDEVQLSTLMNIKSGGCPEDCHYCPQSAHFATGVATFPLVSPVEVENAARRARDCGATRFCIGAAWRSPRSADLRPVLEMITRIKGLGLEACATLGMLTHDQAVALKNAGLDFYNHNLDTSAAYYPQVTSTRTYQERVDTISNARDAGLSVCCGGILGLGESRQDRCEFLRTLASMNRPPESVPINVLVRSPGTPLEAAPDIDKLEVVRVIAVARILMPRAQIRLSAGRTVMSDEMQAFCFAAGASSVFFGDALLTTENPDHARDRGLFQDLGMHAVS